MIERPPPTLLAAFRKREQIEDIAVLMGEEGFDPTIIRVLTAWQHTDQKWRKPKKPPPNGDLPTAANWVWVMKHWAADVTAVADAARVTFSVARASLEALMLNRLIYPDGTMAKAARGAISNFVAAHLPKRKTKEKEPKAPPPPDDEPSGEPN